MAILAALQSAAIRLIGRKPGTFFGASGTFELEITDLANEVAQDAAKYRDWQALVKTATITGDGTDTEFDLPADFDRMLIRSDVQDATSWAWGYSHFLDINAFRYEEARGFAPNPGGWIISGGKLLFAPAPSGQATFPYITKNWAVGSNSAGKAAFTSDSDTFALEDRLLTLGLVWRWRENKKLDYTGDMEAFTKALDEYAAKDGGSRVIRRNSRRSYPGTYPAWPWELG